ncbi:MAG: hypothetical protein V1858_03505 [Candidatus Gottesmanbacteria bacterium]
MVEDCEVGCFLFHALERIDSSLADLNKEARKVAQEGGEFPGSAGSMCGACVTRKKNDTSLEIKKANLKL